METAAPKTGLPTESVTKPVTIAGGCARPGETGSKAVAAIISANNREPPSPTVIDHAYERLVNAKRPRSADLREQGHIALGQTVGKISEFSLATGVAADLPAE